MDKENEKLLAKEEAKVMKKEEIDRRIAQIKAIWEIENMDVDAETEEEMRAYFEGRLTAEEFMGKILNDANDGEG